MEDKRLNLRDWLKKGMLGLLRLYGFFILVPFRPYKNKITSHDELTHTKWIDHLVAQFNKPGMKVLEIGSRNVTGANFRNRFKDATYIGLDVLAGENVDVVGDAHKLSSYFRDDEKFDLIFSSAVFEHLYMPWVVAYEIQKMLKVGGYVFVETHFSFRAHERPWNFFQYSDAGLRALFSDALGFDLVANGMSNPIIGFFSHAADSHLRYSPIFEMYCHSQILCRKREHVGHIDWSAANSAKIVDGTQYPLPSRASNRSEGS